MGFPVMGEILSLGFEFEGVSSDGGETGAREEVEEVEVEVRRSFLGPMAVAGGGEEGGMGRGRGRAA